jgi:hypothetical protein
MSRRIVSIAYQARGANPSVDTYFDRVVKYIPADVVSAWVFVVAAVNGAPDDVPKGTVLWIAFVCGLVLTALWTHRRTSESGLPPAVTQIILATIAFGVWVFALGGPFVTLDFYRPLYGSLLLVLFTLASGLVVPKQ